MVIKMVKMMHMGNNNCIYSEDFTDRKRQIH